MAGFPTEFQHSAGGVVCRDYRGRIAAALIAVGRPPQALRWQLPKGLVERGEPAEVTALREVREETGVLADLLEPIETVEYWYVGRRGDGRVRFHKKVDFFLMMYRSGSVAHHDTEVAEARWVPLDDAGRMLAFANERRVLERAGALLLGTG